MESGLLTQQLEILERRFPAFFASPLEGPSSGLRLEWVAGLIGTLACRGVQLSSRHDRIAEARVQAATLQESSEVVLYGLGLGDLPRVLLERPGLRRLHLVVLNRAIFRELLGHENISELLEDSRLSLTAAVDENQLRKPFFAVPSDLVLIEDEAWKMRDRLVSELQVDFVNQRFSAQNAEHLQRLRANSAFIESDRSVRELFDSALGEEVWVVGAGPTLLETLPRIVASQARFARRPRLVAADTALRTLLAAGVMPDVVVAMDPYLKPEYLGYPCEANLVYFPLVPGEILEAWQGPRFLSLSRSPLYESITGPDRGYLWAGGSVIHPALDLAVKMGSKAITLFGVDFAFVGGRTHAGWENGELGKDLLNAAHWVQSGRGEKVRSSVNFASYLCALEDYISAHPEVTFFNSSDRGALIRGASIRTATEP